MFSLWSEVKNSLGSKGVRYDKFKCIDIRWTREELEKLIAKAPVDVMGTIKPFSMDDIIEDLSNTIDKEMTA